MISKTLVKLIDQAIVPAIILLCTRLIAVIVISYILGVKFSFDDRGFIFPSIESYIQVNSYSTFAMVLVIAAGLFYMLLKALFFHDTHITPNLTAKLFNYHLSSFIQSSFELYSQGVVWLGYSYLLTAMAGVFSYYKLLFPWVFYVSMILSIFSTVILIFDVEEEIKVSMKDHPEENNKKLALGRFSSSF